MRDWAELQRALARITQLEERLEASQEVASDWQRIATDHEAHIRRLEAIIERLRGFVTATAEDEGHLSQEAKALLEEVF